MSSYTAAVTWQRNDQLFTDNRYQRTFSIQFDGGIEVPGSASPHVVPLPLSSANAVDPEDLFVASLAGCHMLWFLALAAKRRFCVDHYHDATVGIMEPDASGVVWMSQVLLRPTVTFSGERQPTREQFEQLHHQAHQHCFIAHSVKTDVRCEPVLKSPPL